MRPSSLSPMPHTHCTHTHTCWYTCPVVCISSLMDSRYSTLIIVFRTIVSIKGSNAGGKKGKRKRERPCMRWSEFIKEAVGMSYESGAELLWTGPHRPALTHS